MCIYRFNYRATGIWLGQGCCNQDFKMRGGGTNFKYLLLILQLTITFVFILI